MPVVLLIVGLVVLAAAVYAATGRGGELSVEHADHAPLDLGPVSATDVVLLRPPSAMWGYDMQATDEALEHIAESIRERDVRIVALEQMVTDLRRGHAPEAPAPEPEPVPAPEPVWAAEPAPIRDPGRAREPDQTREPEHPGQARDPQARDPEHPEQAREPEPVRERATAGPPAWPQRPARSAPANDQPGQPPPQQPPPPERSHG